MTRAITVALLTLLACGAGRAQSAGPKMEFEVASIKPSSPPPAGRPMRVGGNGGPGTKDPTRIAYENMSLSNLLYVAYDLKRYQLTAPDWLDSVRFDVQAKIPEGATKEQFRQMLQNLLTERFKLTVHHETKDLPMFQLVVAKGGPKIKEAVEDPAAQGPDFPPPGPGGPPKMDKNGFPILPPGKGPMTIMMNGRARTVGQETLEQFAGMLSNQISRPVTDATGLKGKYDINLYWSSEGVGLGGAPLPPPPPGAVGPPPPAAAGPTAGLPEGESGPTIYSAIQEQLGLKLEPKRGPVDILVVDHIERVPTEN